MKIKWEDFYHELTRMLNLSSALKEATERKRSLQQKLEPLIQVNAESLSRRNELEDMRQRLKAGKLLIEKTSAASKVAEQDATALGYVAQAVSLIASYLTVPLRYPLHFGGSKTFIRDYGPSIEPLSSDMSSITTLSENPIFVEFHLFLDGQDSTRAAYAVFLLNKNIEQLLNIVGKDSRGSRELLPNLKELIRIIQSPKFLET